MQKTRKRIVTYLFAAILTIFGMYTAGIWTASVSVVQAAEEYVDGDYKYELLSDGTAQITEYTGKEKELQIPSVVGGHTVTKIDNLNPWSRNLPIVSITIPASVKEVYYGIGGVGVMKEIYVDADNPSYTSIDGVLFNKEQTELVAFPKKKRGDYVIPDGVRKIGQQAFSLSELSSITIPEGVEAIGEMAFYQNDFIERMELPASIATIGDKAFLNTALVEIHAVEGNEKYTSVDGVLFSKDMKALLCYPAGRSEASYVIPDGVESVSDYAFQKCIGLNRVEFPDGFVFIGVGAFMDCSNLAEVQFPATLEEIYFQAFYGCKSLTELVIPNSVFEIDMMAFKNCSSLTDVTLPNQISDIESSTFYGCKNLKNINIPYGVMEISSSAFKDCASLSGLVIPSQVSKIAKDAFTGCGALEIQGFAGTTAQTYAKEQKLSFKELKTTSFDITFDACGGTVNTKQKQVKWYEEYDVLPTPERKGYLFDGWYTQKDGGMQVLGNSTVTQGKAHTLYAHWIQPQGYMIHFDEKDGINESGVFNRKVAVGQSVGYLPFVGKDYHPSGRWCRQEGSEMIKKTVLEESMFDENHVLTLYARYIPTSTKVSFDANGGTVDKKSKLVTYSHTYGPLPVPSRVDYEFNGWFTEPKGGTKITKNSKVLVGKKRGSGYGEQTLYAQWTELKKYTVTFDANGGTVEPNSDIVIYGKVYGHLPVPTRKGHTFEGWYTSSAGGSRIQSTSTVVIDSNHTLYAHWKANTYTVTFNASGGNVGTTTKTVAYEGTYGSLPMPTRSGYGFDGWYTAASGGTRITENSKVTTMSNHTLYAHWKKAKQPSVDDMAYKFINSGGNGGFEYYKNGNNYYRIPYNIYVMVFGDTAYARSLYNAVGAWGGNCFGMCSTTSMFYIDGNGYTTQSFNQNATLPYALSIKDYNGTMGVNLTQFIEGLQICCNYDKSTSGYYQKRIGNLSSICNAVKEFENTGNDPVILLIRGNSGGHAVIGYKLENVSNTESRLYIYDPNFSNGIRYITLYKDASGAYTRWYYRLNDAENWGTGYPGEMISYILYSESFTIWQNRDGRKDYNLLNINTENAVLYDGDGEVAAEIKDGEVISKREDIYPVSDIGVTAEGGQSEKKETEIFLPADYYTVRNLDSTIEKFEASMADEEQVAEVATASDEISFVVDDTEETNYVRLPDENTDYEIKLSSTLEGTYEEVTLTDEMNGGQISTDSQEELVFLQMGGNVVAKGDVMNGGAKLQFGYDVMKIQGNEAVGELQSATIEDEVIADEMYLDTDKMSLKPGEAKALTPTILPQITTDKEITWKSSNPSVAQVSSDGVVTAVSGGTAVITAACGEGDAFCEVTVTGNGANLPFVDVSSSDWFQPYVAYVYQNNLMKGLDNTHFGPVQNLARAQFAVILHRMNGEPKVDYTAKFPDVGDGIWYTDAILWASSIKVVNGYSDTGRFGPADYINREQMAVMMYRYADYKGYSTGNKADTSKFKDASQVTGYAREAMKWAYGNGIITGKDYETRLDPQGNASRAECATIIMRFVEKFK